MLSHFIHMNLRKKNDKYLTKTLETNATYDDKTKSISSIMTNPKKSPKIIYSFKEIKSHAYNNLIRKYNTLPYQYNLLQMDNFIKGKYCHSLASFKERLIFEYLDEHLKKMYKIKEINKKIPLFYDYYKVYLDFFCCPIFADLQLSELIKKIVEQKAQVFYDHNFKEESQKKTKNMNLLIFTSKVRRDLSKKTNLTNLSKTTIVEGNLTNKSSIVSAASIAKIFNDIDPTNKINIDENKSFNKRNESNKSNNNNNSIVNKNKNLLSIQIKRNMNLKEKIHLNKKITNLTIENNFRNSYNLNNFNNSNTFSNNFNINNITDISTKYNKLSIKKKKPQVIKIKTESSLESSLRASNTQRDPKKPSLNFNYNGYIYYNNNKSGNNTSSHIMNYTKKRIQKPNSRNYACGFLDNKNTFSHLNPNLNNRMNSLGNNNNNCILSMNSLKTESTIKPKTKKILKYKSDYKKILNNNNNTMSNSIKLGNKIIVKNIVNDNNNNTLKVKGEFNTLNNNNENKNNITVKPYKKVSPYMKPECRSLNIVKVKTNINKKITKISNSMKPKNKISNIKINWNNKERQIDGQKLKFNVQYIKDNCRTLTQNKK